MRSALSLVLFLVIVGAACICAVAATTPSFGLILAATLVPLLVAGTVLASWLFKRERQGFNPLVVWGSAIGALAAVGLVLVGMARLGPGIVVGAAGVCAVIIVASAFVRSGRRERELRAVAGLCETCGYDLRQSQDRCPECGSPIPEELARRRRIAALRAAQRSASAAAGDAAEGTPQATDIPSPPAPRMIPGEREGQGS